MMCSVLYQGMGVMLQVESVSIKCLIRSRQHFLKSTDVQELLFICKICFFSKETSSQGLAMVKWHHLCLVSLPLWGTSVLLPS